MIHISEFSEVKKKNVRVYFPHRISIRVVVYSGSVKPLVDELQNFFATFSVLETY